MAVVSFKMKHFFLSIAATRQVYTRGSLEDSLERETWANARVKLPDGSTKRVLEDSSSETTAL